MVESLIYKCIKRGVIAWMMCASVVASAETVAYRTNRTFQATTTTIGSATVYNIANAATNLTDIIAAPPVTTNSVSAKEYESVTWGHSNFTQAWDKIFIEDPYDEDYPGIIATYSEVFDDPGWIKGTKNAYGKYGAYMWILQNTLGFTTPGTTYYSNNGQTYLLDKVLVGTLGDYQPGTSYTNVFPLMNDPDTNYPGYTHLTNSQPADNSSQTVKYSFDTTAYYRLGYVKAKPDGQVTYIGATQNKYFELTDVSMTDVSWQIDPDLGTNGARLAVSSTGQGTSWATNGTHIWVSPGTIATNYVISVRHNDHPFEIEDKLGFVVSHKPSWTPSGDKIYVWIPSYDYQFDSSFIQELQNKYQGWTYSTNTPITWFEDATSNDNNYGTCTLENLKSMKNGGIVTIMGHGTNGFIELVQFASKTNAETWAGSEDNLYVMPGDNETNYWTVQAGSQWFEDNWKTTLDQNKAIVFLYACSSANGGGLSLAAKVGGKTIFAIDGPQSGLAVGAVYNKIIEYMNSTEDGAEPWQRSAENAFTAATNYYSAIYGSIVAMTKGGESTLCPVPLSVFPQSTEEIKTEWGCIAFDTYMSLVSANTAVKPTSGSVSGRSWGNDATGHFFVDFSYTGTNITMEAVSNQCRSVVSVYPGRPLDGDAIAPMSTNGQSRIWSW